MRKLFILLFVLSLFVVVQAQAREGGWRDGYIELLAGDTLTTTTAATDSVRVYTTEFEGLPPDTTKWGIWMLAKESGAQVGNLDVDLIFSPDSSSGFSAYRALKADLDVGGTCPDQWYHFGLGANADELIHMKWVGINIMNTDADAETIIIKSLGICFTEEE